ncbi:hypothetical protein H0H93_015281, partial [Arthromyces matolae]
KRPNLRLSWIPRPPNVPTKFPWVESEEIFWLVLGDFGGIPYKKTPNLSGNLGPIRTKSAIFVRTKTAILENFGINDARVLTGVLVRPLGLCG